MSHKHRVKQLEQRLGVGCERHQAVVVHAEIKDVATWQAITDNQLEGTGVEPLFCPRCGAALPLLVLPGERTLEEWQKELGEWQAVEI